jgi:hypothetical protein
VGWGVVFYDVGLVLVEAQFGCDVIIRLIQASIISFLITTTNHPKAQQAAAGQAKQYRLTRKAAVRRK